jgi:galactonate dehydratase
MIHPAAGWRDFSLLKVTTDDGLVGWSEYNKGYGSVALTAVVRRMAQGLIGQDLSPIERIMSAVYAITRQATGGVNQQAMAAIDNSCSWQNQSPASCQPALSCAISINALNAAE